MNEAQKEYHRKYNAVYHMRTYRPDGRMPRELIAQVRRECLRMGGYPGHTKDVQLAICSLWEWTEEGSEEWCWLHPAEVVQLTNTLVCGWRSLKESTREKILRG